MDLDGRGGGKELRAVGGEKTEIRNVMWGKTIFNKRKRKKEHALEISVRTRLQPSKCLFNGSMSRVAGV